MKKLFLILFCMVSLSAFAQPRFGIRPHADKSGKTVDYAYLTPEYVDTLKLVPNAYETIIVGAQLAGDQVVTINSTYAKPGDKLYIVFKADGNIRTLTFSTGFQQLVLKYIGQFNSTTLYPNISVWPNERALLTFMYDGTDWLEMTEVYDINND